MKTTFCIVLTAAECVTMSVNNTPVQPFSGKYEISALEIRSDDSTPTFNGTETLQQYICQYWRDDNATKILPYYPWGNQVKTEFELDTGEGKLMADRRQDA